MRKLTSEYPYQLKFVVIEPGDVDEILTMLNDIGADRSRVVLMPEGIGAEALRDRARWLVELCKQRGFRYSPRLHIDIWGNERGV